MTPRPRSQTGSPAHWLGRLAVAAALAGAGTLVIVAGASAHVLIESTTPNGDGTTTITFTFDHGCDGDPTSRLEVRLPSGVSATRAIDPAGWSSVLTAEGVAWEGSPIADGDQRQFGLVTTIAGTIGQSFRFPTVQSCEGGGSRSWTDPSDSSNTPAPAFVATGATLTARPPGAGQPASEESGGASLAQALAAVVALTAVTYAGTSIRSRRRPFPTGRPDHGDRHPPRHTE